MGLTDASLIDLWKKRKVYTDAHLNVLSKENPLPPARKIFFSIRLSYQEVSNVSRFDPSLHSQGRSHSRLPSFILFCRRLSIFLSFPTFSRQNCSRDRRQWRYEIRSQNGTQFVLFPIRAPQQKKPKNGPRARTRIEWERSE